jgi:hypothetical protein
VCVTHKLEVRNAQSGMHMHLVGWKQEQEKEAARLLHTWACPMPAA